MEPMSHPTMQTVKKTQPFSATMATKSLLSKANDGQNDCSDGEDEYSWVLESRYTCDNGETIDFDETNDG